MRSNIFYTVHSDDGQSNILKYEEAIKQYEDKGALVRIKTKDLFPRFRIILENYILEDKQYSVIL